MADDLYDTERYLFQISINIFRRSDISKIFFLTVLFCQMDTAISGYRTFLNPFRMFQIIPASANAGNPLFLTPYIESNKTKEGQAESKVLLPGLNVTSHSGFITVNKTSNSSFFFWYFPSEADPKKASVVLWLQGGPGISSLFGLFNENGPFFLDKDRTLKERKYSWSRVFNVIYIDNPIGTGFSYTRDTSEYATNEIKIGNDLYSVLIQFFQLFPDLQKNDFYISGESYAGKYVPALGYTIDKNNKVSNQKINLKGLCIGNGLTDPENMLVYADYFYHLGLVDSNTRDTLTKSQDEAVNLIKQHQYLQAVPIFSNFSTVIPHINMYNYLQNASLENLTHFSEYVQRDSVRSCIHVGNGIFSNGSEVERSLRNDIMQSVKPWIEDLLENYRIMFYNGQLDLAIGYPLTVNSLKRLNWTGSEEYKRATRTEWMVDGELAGFYKKAKGLVEVLVRNAGHLVPVDQPKWALNLMTRFISNDF